VNPNLSRASVTPANSKYFVTTPLPGDKLVLMYGLTDNPLLTAFYARIPAASITSGFEVFVQDVMAAITTEP
jgi:hypothetical protein